MVVDGMMKPLDRTAFQRFKDLMGMTWRNGTQGQEESQTVSNARGSGSNLEVICKDLE